MVEPSAPLVPIDDDTLLWINSGVATLKIQQRNLDIFV
jgi:alanyl-tRNA synthetase